MCTIVGAVMFRDHPGLGWLVVLTVIGAGLAIGLVNSVVIVSMRIGNAFIVTLGMLYAVQSLSYVASGGTQGQPPRSGYASAATCSGFPATASRSSSSATTSKKSSPSPIAA